MELRHAAAKVKARQSPVGQPPVLQAPKSPSTPCGRSKKSHKRRPKLAQAPEALEEVIQVIPAFAPLESLSIC